MKRRNSKKRERWSEGDINPMDGVANLADVMLCLAVGIMLALITHWNVDINVGGASGTSGGANAKEIEENRLNKVDENRVNINEDGDGYEHMGQVYRDPNTGKIYMVSGE